MSASHSERGPWPRSGRRCPTVNVEVADRGLRDDRAVRVVGLPDAVVDVADRGVPVHVELQVGDGQLHVPTHATCQATTRATGRRPTHRVEVCGESWRACLKTRVAVAKRLFTVSCAHGRDPRRPPVSRTAQDGAAACRLGRRRPHALSLTCRLFGRQFGHYPLPDARSQPWWSRV